MDQLKIHRIKNREDRHFAQFWNIYSKSFPLCERRTSKRQIEVFKKIEYKVNGYLSENKIIGFIAFWTAKQFVFVEHFAVLELIRSQGFGSTILKAFTERVEVPVILEIEPPVDDPTVRRLRFYESLGFVQNEQIHLQPPYHPWDQPLRLDILTYQYQINSELYGDFSEFQKNTIKN